MRNDLRNIEKLVEKSISGKQKFAVFDFDNTCIINDIAEATLAYLCENKLLREKNLLNGELLLTDEYHKKVFRCYYDLLEKNKTREAYILSSQAISGFTLEEIRVLVKKVIEVEGKDIGFRELYGVAVTKGLILRKEVKELMFVLENHDITIWVISASPQALVKTAAEEFGIKRQVIGIKNNIKEGLLAKELEEPLSIMSGKVECIKTFISKGERPLLAIGDSINDLPMIEYAEIKVVVNRQNKLTELAQKRGWFIL